jgi:aspartyl-tRNA(Asn)/glutamyl-tRNA(Gln) amidotransferase subunit A
MMAVHRFSIAELHAAYASGTTTPLAVTQAYFERIKRLDGALGAYVALDRERALADAAAPQAGALSGVPLAVKSNIDVAGLATTAGIAGRRDAVAATDAEVVKLLRGAGAVILGHVNMAEAAAGATTDNEAYGRTVNPHDPARTAGGSSGGSGAAVGAALCVAALGTDTLGSVRIPAAYNGVYGIKPTNGAVPDAGLVPLSTKFDAIGPLARSLPDLAAVLGALMPRGAPRPVVKIALLDVVDRVDVERSVMSAYDLAVSVARGLDIGVQRYRFDVDLTKVRVGGFVEALDEARGYFADALATNPEGFSRQFRAMLDFAAASPPDVRRVAAKALDDVRTQLSAILADADVVLLPTTPQAAFAHGQGPVNQADFTGIANVAGLPALSFPGGWTEDGLPIGLQLIGRSGGEATLLAFAARLDTVLGAYRMPTAFN